MKWAIIYSSFGRDSLVMIKKIVAFLHRPSLKIKTKSSKNEKRKKEDKKYRLCIKQAKHYLYFTCKIIFYAQKTSIMETMASANPAI